ncbi:MAG: hypothetical protein PHQ23_03795 [Candidatus Wallbacteria bacterium]|nr:hypothetical protein [Candidatus Wallbacteria bacterium]
MKKTFCTSTVINERFTVPWLAADGPLSYSPENPPDRDYYFQYSWIIPGIFNDKVNKKCHHWFGECSKNEYRVEFLFDFWRNARRGIVKQVYLKNGCINPESLEAPIAVYKHEEALVFIQHGSYLIIKEHEQALTGSGNVFLYRGIGEGKVYRHHKVSNLNDHVSLMKVHAGTLMDSVVSFNTVHCNIKRCESAEFNDQTYLLSQHALIHGLNLKSEALRSALYNGYSLRKCYGKNKFGPHFVKFLTPLSNIRITTFVAGEDEVKVIDPHKLEIVESFGCRVKEE